MSAFNAIEFLSEEAPTNLKLTMVQWDEVAELMRKSHDRGYLRYEAELTGALTHRRPDEVQYRLRHVGYAGGYTDGMVIYTSREAAEKQAEVMANLIRGVYQVVQSRGLYGTEWSDWRDA